MSLKGGTSFDATGLKECIAIRFMSIRCIPVSKVGFNINPPNQVHLRKVKGGRNFYEFSLHFQAFNVGVILRFRRDLEKFVEYGNITNYNFVGDS